MLNYLACYDEKLCDQNQKSAYFDDTNWNADCDDADESDADESDAGEGGDDVADDESYADAYWDAAC